MKKALGENAKQLRLTGGGEASFTNLNETDNLMASLLAPEEYAGLGAADECGLPSAKMECDMGNQGNRSAAKESLWGHEDPQKEFEDIDSNSGGEDNKSLTAIMGGSTKKGGCAHWRQITVLRKEVA